MNPEAFLEAIRTFDQAGPVISVSLDLRRGPDGRPRALQALNAAGDAATDDLPDEQELRAILDALRDDVTAAMNAGSLGYISIIVPGDGGSRSLTTPVPFRNRVRVAPRPWLFEFGRMAYLAARPVVYVRVSRNEMRLVRVEMANLAFVEDVEREAHFARNIRG